MSSCSSSAKAARSWMKAEAGLGLVAHQPLDRVARIGRSSAVDDDLQKRALPRVHGGFLELRGHHLAQALEAADLDLAACP